jgi:hypothetical protein
MTSRLGTGKPITFFFTVYGKIKVGPVLFVYENELAYLRGQKDASGRVESSASVQRHPVVLQDLLAPSERRVFSAACAPSFASDYRVG